MEFAHVVFDGVSRHDRLAELRLVDGEEEDLLRARVLGDARGDADGAGGLRHALDDEDTRKDRPRGEMARELRLVEGDVLDADAGPVAVDVDDTVDEKKRVAMRQEVEDLDDIGRLERGCRLAHAISDASVRALEHGPANGHRFAQKTMRL